MHCTRVFSSPDIHISSFLDMDKTSGHVSFNLNLETSMWKTPARARIKCRGRIYILLNAANVVLHTAIKTKALVLFRSCCLIEKSLKRVEVPCLFYVIWLKTIHTLNYYYYSIYLKKTECLKIITTLVKQAYTDFLVFRFILTNPVFIIISIQKNE